MVTLGLRYDLRNPAFAGTSMAERYACAIEQCAWADERGFSAVTLSEHHGADDGYLPALLPMAAAIAARTSRLRIRLAAVVAPFHDPLRLAEDVAVVDQISRGRLELVIANGYVPSEFAMFGRSPAGRVKAVEETIATLRSAFTGEAFAFRGRTVRVTPRPFQDPGPPILLGGASEAAARRAARLGDGFVPTTPDLWAPYRDELARLGKPDPTGGGGSPIAMYLHVAHDPDATWEVVAPYALHEMNSYGAWAAESGAATGYQPMTDAAALRGFGMHLVVTPEELLCRIGEAGSRAAVLFHPLMGGLPPALSWENLRLFEQAVLGHLALGGRS